MYSDFCSKPLTETVIITFNVVFMAFVKLFGDTRYPGVLRLVNRVVPNKITNCKGSLVLKAPRAPESDVEP